MSSMNKTKECPTISDLFCQLNSWRHLPDYQLERRADIFFALFLPEVLGKHFGICINPILIPEFPIKKVAVAPWLAKSRRDNRSIKVDYLALQKSPDGKFAEQAFLVELKTDIASRREEQDKYLGYAVDAGLQKLIKGVLEICSVTRQKSKYVHLLYLLSKANLIEYEDNLFPVRSGKYSEALKRIKEKLEKRNDWPSLKVVYIQPELIDTIGFNEFACLLEMVEGGEIRGLFARCLRTWVTDKAGSTNPKTLHSC